MICDVSEAIAYALVDLGVQLVTHVPGYGGSQTFQKYNAISMHNPVVSFNEEVAYTIAHGCAIAGKRSASMMKTHGIAKAGNSVTDSLYTDLTAGMIVLVFDDKTGLHSDNILETEILLKGMSMPYLISRHENIYSEITKAYDYSEKKKLPVAIIIDSAVIENKIEITRSESLKKTFEYKRDIIKHIVHPLFAGYQYNLFKARRNGSDTTSIVRPTIPAYTECNKFKSSEKYLQFFEAFKNVRCDIVTGDTSSSCMFMLPPYNSIDITTHIGGSIPLALGAYHAGFRKVWALTGDFGFIAAGHMGLIEVLERDIPLKVVIFYNKEASATGGQKIHKRIMLRLLAGYDSFIKHISNPNDLIEVSEVLKEVSESDSFKIILVDY
ncbi:MAG: thiamine pyrophosphate-dependent enzyme [bacterium]